MKAVNLIPSGSGRDGRGTSLATHAPTYVVFGVLAIAVAFVTVYVLTSNSISQQKAKLASLQEQVSQIQAESSTLANYTQFAQLVQQRVAAVRTIAETRFDWQTAFTDLSKVVPANTSLQSLNASLTPGTSTGAGSGGSSVLRSAISSPAFDLTGCTRTQDDVARLMSRLRLIDGVTRVTLGQAQKADSSTGGTAVAATGGSGGAAGSSGGCSANMPTFDILVFLTPVAGSSVVGTSTGAQPSTPTTSGSTTTTPGSTTTTSGSTATTPGSTTTTSGSTATTLGSTTTTTGSTTPAPGPTTPGSTGAGSSTTGATTTPGAAK
jgi:Tfp pilus assembly protein PilN